MTAVPSFPSTTDLSQAQEQTRASAAQAEADLAEQTVKLAESRQLSLRIRQLEESW